MNAILLAVLAIEYVCSSNIYTSINWNPENPFFTTKSKNCSSGYMTLNVQLHSKIYFICPNTATVFKETSTAPQTANLYENLWIVRNRMVFDECDTSLETGNKSSIFFFRCNTPTSLKYLLVVFTEFTADPNEPKFEGGKKYYFIGTSDGTQTHINDTKGGHCNDTEKGIFMKIEVYVCRESNQTYTDSECKSDVGQLKCQESQTTTTPAYTENVHTSQKPEQEARIMDEEVKVQKDSDNKSDVGVIKSPEVETELIEVETTSPITLISTESVKPNSAVTKTPEHDGHACEIKVQKELKAWRASAIVFACTSAVFLFALICVLCRKRHRKRNLPLDTKEDVD